MNTTLTAVRSPGSTIGVRRRARLVHERIAIRAGVALVAWGRRNDAHLTHEAVQHARRNAIAGSALRDATYNGIATATRQSF
ncbi:hypothetical protein [Agromyces sp. LHK192]|uniref:hypothetical protein n=1 Tax=Agromyces sp. LHK192 TaxID=2498704 RepID=UPI000FD75350|nr:hypothetical protein [Agromyces sp. LHK192]